MTSVNVVFAQGGPQLGELEAGIVAQLFGAPFSVVSGGLASLLATGWIAWKTPALRNYGAEEYTLQPVPRGAPVHARAHRVPAAAPQLAEAPARPLSQAS
jgi:hypothetical protein